MDLRGVFLTNENIEFTGIICDHDYEIAWLQLLHQFFFSIWTQHDVFVSVQVLNYFL